MMLPSEESQSGSLSGQRVAIAGRLATLSRGQVQQLVERLGGRSVQRVDEQTTLVVVGEGSWPLTRRGRMDANLRRVFRLSRQGLAPAIRPEREFLRQVGELPSAMLVQRYTLREIARLVRLPIRSLQAWIDRGWIRPAGSCLGIDLFDYQGIVRMRHLAALLASGVSAGRLARSLRQLQRWHADAGQGLTQLSMLAWSKRVLARLPDGRLIEPGGQLLLPLEEPSEQMAIAAEPPQSLDDLADAAWELEQSGLYAEAAAMYERLLEGAASDAQLWLNYGNVLYALGRRAEAAEAFRRATERDGALAAGWNNLGAACLDLGQFDEAEAALRRALAIDANDADAHQNLTDLLSACGREDEAEEHRKIYLVQ